MYKTLESNEKNQQEIIQKVNILNNEIKDIYQIVENMKVLYIYIYINIY